MTEPIYFKKFNFAKESPFYHFRDFHDNLVSDPENNEKLALYEDIFTEKRENLRWVFQNTGRDDVADIALMELSNLTPSKIRQDFTLFESIVNKSIRGEYGEKNETVLKNMLVLYSKHECALSYEKVKGLLVNEKVTTQIRLMFAKALSENDHATRFPWNKVDLRNNNSIIPGYVYYYHKTDPEKALIALKNVYPKFGNEFGDFFYHGIEEAMLQLVHQKKEKSFQKIFRAIESEDIRSVVKEVISLEDNLLDVLKPDTSKELESWFKKMMNTNFKDATIALVQSMKP